MAPSIRLRMASADAFRGVEIAPGTVCPRVGLLRQHAWRQCRFVLGLIHYFSRVVLGHGGEAARVINNFNGVSTAPDAGSNLSVTESQTFVHFLRSL